MKEIIIFKKERDLGTILTDSFKFVRQEYKTIFKALLHNVAIPFLLLLAGTAYYTASLGDFNFLITGGASAFGANIFIALLFFFVTNILFIGAFYGTMMEYIKSYIDNGGNVNLEEVNSNTKHRFLSLFGASCLISIITVAGLFFCILPGIYLGVVLMMVYPLMIFNNRSTTDAINESFSFIKNEWWMSFATMVVMYLLIYVVKLVFSIPAVIYSFTKAFTGNSTISSGDPSSMFDWVYITLSTLSSAVGYLLLTFMAVAIAIIYFNINEKKNQTGILEEIDSIGSDI
ncbi:MAG: hypothetical protein CL868_09215 [Cytophagaceae bacterium]|nr:hypothetical protein [Cytophagaceae bacterium]|tara:strand:+ start:3041 stop:3904 length:864 start_codon:yes stop_codon:yes gene_type:complete